MGLVDYSDSESDSEMVMKPAPSAEATSAKTTKAAIQKVVDRANPRKILVNLTGSSGKEETTLLTSDEPPAKRARIGGGGGGAFSGFNSLLPPPKNVGKSAVSSSSGKNVPMPGINLKTGATPGFSRSSDFDDGETAPDTSSSVSTHLPAPKSQQPSIPEGQTPADEVKLVGKPLMFKPLSVSRKSVKKKAASIAGTANANGVGVPVSAAVSQLQAESVPKKEPPKKKASLFSIADEPSDDVETTSSSGTGTYEPLFPTSDATSTSEAFAQYDAQYSMPQPSPAQATGLESLDSIASDMNLSAEARRELFGRRGAPAPTQSAAKVINFNTDAEYAHNEELRASGEQQIHNPLRAIAPGKHSLRQLVNQVQNQREALEDSFAKGKSNRNEAGSKYGWR